MSIALIRRNSSKQGLQNLLRLTAQRSIEDAEEVERERRRRARKALRWRNSGSAPEESSPGGEMRADDSVYDGGLKPSSSPSLEEDEGFSDWTQRRERRRQQRLKELSQGGEEDEDEEEDRIKSSQACVESSDLRLRRQEQEQERQEEAARAERERRQCDREEEDHRKKDKLTPRRSVETQRPNTEVEKRKEVQMCFTSKVFLQKEPKHDNSSGTEEVTSHISKSTRSSRVLCSRGGEPEEAEAILETERRLEKIRRGLQEKECQELEQLRQRQAEAEQELEELKRRKERCLAREEEESRRGMEEQQRLAKEEEERRQMKEDIERRRMEAAERMKNLSTSSVDGDEMFSPFSPKTPTHKITERTESLSRSLKKSNSFKKAQPLVLLSKIDDKMEQYAHAVENSQDSQAVKASPTDLLNSPEVVASKKTLFEAVEAWNQSPSKGPTCKGDGSIPPLHLETESQVSDTEGLKVGVANLITHWVKGPSDCSGKQSASRPADLKPGDVMQKKNMWEGIGDSSGWPGQRLKGSTGSKKYKFVVTGHGKYEKISADDASGGDFTNGKADFCGGGY